MEQYPHYLYMRMPNKPQMLKNGDWSSTEGDWTLIGRCREETNGKGAEIVRSDYKTFKFSSLIQCPVGTQIIEEGCRVKVTDKPIEEEGRVRIEGDCAKFDDGRLHCRLWV